MGERAARYVTGRPHFFGSHVSTAGERSALLTRPMPSERKKLFSLMHGDLFIAHFLPADAAATHRPGGVPPTSVSLEYPSPADQRNQPD